MRMKWALCLGAIATVILPIGAAKAETYEECVDSAWQDLKNCSSEAFSDAGSHILRDTTIGGAAGAAGGAFFGPSGAAIGGRAGAAAGFAESSVGEFYEQLECGAHAAFQYANCQSKPSGSVGSSSGNQGGYSFDPYDSSSYYRDTTGDGIPDQSYPNGYDEDYYGYSESFGDTFNRYSDW